MDVFNAQAVQQIYQSTFMYNMKCKKYVRTHIKSFKTSITGQDVITSHNYSIQTFFKKEYFVLAQCLTAVAEKHFDLFITST